jgi:hypothetical protein
VGWIALLDVDRLVQDASLHDCTVTQVAPDTMTILKCLAYQFCASLHDCTVTQVAPDPMTILKCLAYPVFSC